MPRIMGPVAFARKAAHRVSGTVHWEQRLNDWEARRFDHRLGIDTSGWIEPAGLSVVEGDVQSGFTYVGTQVRVARWWLAALPREPGDFTFVDMGSGKARVLAYAAQHGFGRSLGVEFAKELHDVATENERILRRRGLVIEPILADAARFSFPDEPLVVHFNNPFGDPVMERVIENLSTSYERSPRPIVAVYQQLKDELPGHRTRNLELLRGVPFLAGRQLEPPRGLLDRHVLAPFVVWIFESAEIRSGPERA